MEYEKFINVEEEISSMDYERLLLLMLDTDMDKLLLDAFEKGHIM